MNSTLILSSNAAGNGVAVLSNLWQSYGGWYGDYYVLINAASIALLLVSRTRKCLPWLEEPLHKWLLSTLKLQADGVALWATGNLQTHHQHMVVFCLGSSAHERFGGNWMTWPDVRTLWYGAFVRILSIACMYTLLSAMFLQYNKLSGCYVVSTFVILILSRTYEVLYPWLASIDSPRTLSEQLKQGLSEFDEEVSISVLTSAKLLWPSDFPTVTHIRLEELKLRMRFSGIFVSLFPLGTSTTGSTSHIHQLCHHGWVNGSGLLASADIISATFGFLGVAMAKDSTVSWKVTVASLYFECFLVLSFLTLPAVIVSLNRVSKIVTDRSYPLIWWSELQSWWLVLLRFLHLLVTSGFPFRYQTTVLGSRASVLFWELLSRLEGIELALYVCLTVLLTVSVDLSIYSLALPIKYAPEAGKYVSFICSKMKSLVIWCILRMPFYPGSSSVGTEILNAETALAAQRICNNGQCIKTLRLDEVLVHLEEIVAAKGAIQHPCTFFYRCREAEENIEPLDEEFKRRAIALGLMRSARTAVDNLRRARLANEGASALHSLLRLLRVYTMDSTVPDAKTQDSMIAVADLVQRLMTQFTTLHWESYKDRDVLERNRCGCVLERDWLIIVAQLRVGMLLVYTGWRSSSLYWPYVQFPSQALRDWVDARSTICNGADECAFVLID